MHVRLVCCDAMMQGSTYVISVLPFVAFLQACAAGDSSAYQRRNSALDDVVIVAALRTPLTKVRAQAAC